MVPSALQSVRQRVSCLLVFKCDDSQSIKIMRDVFVRLTEWLFLAILRL